jgi:hypothetical protein
MSVLVIVYIQAKHSRPVHRLESDNRLAVDRDLYQLIGEEPSTRRPPSLKCTVYCTIPSDRP